MSAGAAVTGHCHCGAVSFTLAYAPKHINHCNCSICRRYGVLWAYYELSDVALEAASDALESYAWGPKNVDFYRCANCGCMTHWLPRSAKRNRMGINTRMLDASLIAAAEIGREDMAGDGLFF